VLKAPRGVRITKPMESQRYYRHIFIRAEKTGFTLREKFLDGTLPVGRPGWGGACPALCCPSFQPRLDPARAASVV
jgi:hypothetical protein